MLRRRKVSSAGSRKYALRVVPRRPASTSTARSRSSGRDTITFAMPGVCPVLPLRIEWRTIDRKLVGGLAYEGATRDGAYWSVAHGSAMTGPARIGLRFVVCDPRSPHQTQDAQTVAR